MKVLITGATGSLGGYLTRYFSKKGYTVIASGKDKEPPAELLKYASYVTADIREEVIFPEVDVCIHTAALSDDKASVKDLYLPNVQGTRNVLKAINGCKTYIHVSSSSVYLPSTEAISEDLAGMQDNSKLSPYGSSKLQAEKAVHEACTAASCFILRPRALYGPGDKVILPRLLKLEKDGTLSCPGGLDVRVSMTHYENFAGAIEHCINSDKTGIHTYNVADAPTYILIDVLRNICEQLNGRPAVEKAIPVILLKILAQFKIGGITKLLVRTLTQDMVLDLSKIYRELDYKPQTDFYSSFPEIRDWVNSIGGKAVISSGEKELAWK